MRALRNISRAARSWGLFVGIVCFASTAVAQEAPLVVAGQEVVLESARLREAQPSVHALVTLTAVPGEVERAMLSDLGVELHDYIPDLTWYAHVPAGKGSALLALPFVRGGEPVRPEWKGRPGMAENPADHLWNLSDGRLLAHAYFHSDVSFEDARSAVVKAGAMPLEAEFVVQRRLRTEGNVESMRALLIDDRVRWMETGHRVRSATNTDAGEIHGATEVAQSPFGLDGTGARVGVMDSDVVQSNHPDFGGRVTVVQTNGASSEFHATHVTGTILGSGATDSDAKGMAPGARSWNWTFETDDPVGVKSTGLLTYDIAADNNSWGNVSGWELFGDSWFWYGTSDFGAYTADVGDLDGSARSSGALILFAAGNDGNDDGYDGFGYTYYCYYGAYYLYCGTYSGHYDVDPDSGYSFFHSGYHAPDGGVNRLGNVGSHASMKNGISVAAMDNYGDIAYFSSAGPAKDGRMKPDCAAIGVDVWSTVPTNSHESSQGTSMATPVVTGLSALVIEAWAASHDGDAPPLDVLKGLLLHSCVDLGATGPDYRFGFGYPWTPYACALALWGDGVDGNYLRTSTVTHQQSREYLVEVESGDTILLATLCWIDVPGSPSAQKALVNDLDLELIAPNSAKTLPWTLNPANPSAAATRGVNTLDTVERAEVSYPVAGVWTIRVKGSLIPSGSQPFALWLSHPRANRNPVADAGIDRIQSAQTPTSGTVNLSGANSSEPDGDDSIVEHRWDTDDDGLYDDIGGSAIGSIVAVSLPLGVHNVSLRVTDSFGGIGTDDVVITVVNDPPTAALGGDRSLRANTPSGVLAQLNTSASTDPQGPVDIVAAEWDLDGDGEYDDATGSSVEMALPLGEHELGLRLRDTFGNEDVDRAVLTVAGAENQMRLGGTLKGTLNHSGGEDRDSAFLEAVAGSTFNLKIKGAFPYRVTLYGPSGETVFERTWSAALKTISIKDLILPETGWYWLEMAPAGSLVTSSYTMQFQVKPPKSKVKKLASLTSLAKFKDYEVPLLEGSSLAASVKASGVVSLLLFSPSGEEIANSVKGKLVATAHAGSGTYVLRVFGDPVGELPFTLQWKPKPPKEKSKLEEAD